MGSYGIIIKTEEIRRRVQNGDYDSAQKIIDTMALKKVKNIADLTLFAEVYIQNKRYDDAMELLYRVYKKSKTRRILNQMVIAAIGRKNIEEAERFLSEYKTAAPNDYNYYIYRYKIDKLKKEPYDVLIDSLKKLKQYTYLEKWTYELAKLYYKAGMEKECIQECSDIILIFGEGSYVEKAKILKAYYSGEVDKDEIIEKLKSRAGMETKDLSEQVGQISEKAGLGNQTVDEAGPENEHAESGNEADWNNQNAISGNETGRDDKNTIYYNETGSDSYSIVSDKEAGNQYYDSGKELVKQEEKEGPEDDVKLNFADEEIKENFLDEITDNVRKEIHSLLEKEHNTDKIKALAQNDTEDEANSVFNLYEINEDLERLDQLSEKLDVNLRRIFGNFLHVRELQKQLVKNLELIMDKRTKSVQMIITGAPASGKTTLAKELAIFLNKTGKLKTSRIAKISAEKLNNIDITKRREEIRNCCLIVENASELKQPAIEKILELIKYFRGDIAVVFEENKKNLNRLFRECPKIMELFKNRIHIPLYTEEDLMNFAYANIALRGYKLHPSALEPLKNGLYEIINNEEKDKRLEKISEFIGNAMTSADIRTGKELPRLTAEQRLKDIEVVSLLPEDFTKQIIS